MLIKKIFSAFFIVLLFFFLLLFISNPKPFLEVINYEIIADEIVGTLVGSIGLILAVPITTFLAIYYLRKK